MPADTASPNRFRRFVALGDSLTEGMCDPVGPAAAPPMPGSAPGPWRGWADRVAEALAGYAAADGAGFEYANLAVRGKLMQQIVDQQVPAALALQPDLVSLIGGGNDVLRPGADVDAVAARLESGVVRLRATGAFVLIATSYDPNPSPLVRRTRGAAGVFAAHVWTIARRHDVAVIDLWGMRALQDLRMWAADRIHLTPAGHARVAAQALQVLGFEAAPGPPHWDLPLDPEPRRTRSQILREDAVWMREHVLPWVGRRLLRQSSGDGRLPKRPVPGPVEPRVDAGELPSA